MSQAEALLNSLAESDVYSTNSDAIIVIGTDRVITVPDSLKRIAVQYDHNIETVTFDCPRFWDGHDMSQMKIYINYMRPNETTGQYLAKNIQTSGRRMTFDWTISKNVTQYKGKLSVLVCIKKTDVAGDEENHWNSELNQDFYVSEGMECTPTIVSRYPDIITQLLTRMDEVEAIATPEAMQAYAETWLEENHDSLLAEINSKGEEVLASIPTDYTTTATLAEEGAHKKANAIGQTAEGEIITVSDSADAYLLGLNLHGKTTQVTTTGAQLLDFDPHVTNLTASESYCHVSAYMNPFATAGTYYYSCTGTFGTSYKIWAYDSSENLLINNAAGVIEVTAEQAAAIVKVSIVIQGVASGTTYNGYIYPMINIGDTALPYEPYTGGTASPSPDWPQSLTSIENPTVGVYGKNLLYYNADSSTKTNNGITFTINADGGVTCEGTSTTEPALLNLLTIYEMPMQFVPGKTYAVSGLSSDVAIQIYDWRNKWVHRTTVTSEGSFVVNAEASGLLIRLVINPDITVNTTVYPMIRLAEEVDATYEEYRAEQKLSTVHALNGIPVTSGGNYTDSEGQQWICDEIDFERGVYIQRIHTLTLTGDETISRENNTTWSQGCYVVYTKTRNPEHMHGEVMCSFLPASSNADLADSKYESGIGTHGQPNLMVKFGSDVNTLDLFKDAWANAIANGGQVNVILATPIETPLTAEEIANFKMIRSNYPNTTILNDSGAHVVAKYTADTKKYVDSHSVAKLTSPDGTVWNLTVSNDGTITAVKI